MSYWYRIDLKTGDYAMAQDPRNPDEVRLEFLNVVATLKGAKVASSGEALIDRARELGWFFLKTGMWLASRVSGISQVVENTPDVEDDDDEDDEEDLDELDDDDDDDEEPLGLTEAEEPEPEVLKVD